MSSRWVEQEAQPGYVPPSASWPPPSQQPPRAAIPELRKASALCGGADGVACRETTFSLAVALLGGSLFGHAVAEDAAAEPTADERAEGVALLQRLAEHGLPQGLCAWAFCLLDGDMVPQDAPAAIECHRRAAAAGYAQSMHELGVIYYTGEWQAEGVPEDPALAAAWLQRAAERGGVSGAMYLWGECLLEGIGAPADTKQAFRWFAAAGELGHRGARQRILDLVAHEEEQKRYNAVAGRRGALWQHKVGA